MVGRDKSLYETINFRPAIKSDIPQLVNLMNSQYSRKKCESYFLWQYFNSIYPTVLMCALIDNKVIGMFGLQKRRLDNGAVVGQAIDLLVTTEWRRKGIFKRLGEKALSHFKDLDILCVFPNLNGKNACEKGLGWQTLSKINSMCIRHGYLRNRIEEFKSTYNKNTLYKFSYNKAIRKWRFDRHPEYKYSCVPENSRTFIITKVFIDPINGRLIGDIVDFECDLNDKTTLSELFLKGCLHLKEQDVENITTWALQHTPLREVVESLGFVEMPQERYFCVKILNKKYEYLYNFSRWHLVQADAEIY